MIPPPPPLPPPHDPHSMEANGRYQTKTESPALIVFLNVVNTVTQLLLGAVAFSAFCIASILGWSSSFSQHIYLCVIGYVILMSQAILSFNTHAGWAYSLKYPQKRMIHWMMQIAGSAFAITGSAIRFNDMNTNFDSAHAITDLNKPLNKYCTKIAGALMFVFGLTVGFVAMIMTILSLLGGIMNLLFPTQMGAILYRILHICLGIATISIAFVSLCLGFNDIYRFVFGDINADLSIALTVFALAGIHISAFAKIFKRLSE